MSIWNPTLRPRPASGELWYFAGRDRALTSAILGGLTPAWAVRLYGVPYLRVLLIVRKTCARAAPRWVDRWGMPWAWSVSLEVLREERARFGL